MKKEETIAMVGEKNIGGRWTWERMAAVVLWGIAIFLGCLTFALRLAPLVMPAGLSMMGAVVLSGLSTAGRKVFFTSLRIKKIIGRQHAEVIGKDGRVYEIELTGTVFNVLEKDKESYVGVNGRLKALQAVLVIGSNINQIWK